MGKRSSTQAKPWLNSNGRPSGRPRPAADRFWEKVNKNGPIPEHAPDLGPCWLWMGCRTKAGYGQFKSTYGRPADYTHRWSYEATNGPIPNGLHLDHLCRVRACCNPAHLEAVTNRENTLRGEGPLAQKARQTHCMNGHELTPENTYLNAGKRRCRPCNLDWQKARRAAG